MDAVHTVYCILKAIDQKSSAELVLLKDFDTTYLSFHYFIYYMNGNVFTALCVLLTISVEQSDSELRNDLITLAS